MLNAVRQRRWRHKHRDWVRRMQAEIGDLKAVIQHREEMINMLRWELKYQVRREKFQSWLIGGMPVEDADEEPEK
jgi:hypothetical protein